MFEEKSVDIILGLSKIVMRYKKDFIFRKKVNKLQEEICNNRNSTYDSLQKLSKLKMCEVADVCNLLESRGAIRVIRSDSDEIFQIRVVDKYKFL